MNLSINTFRLPIGSNNERSSFLGLGCSAGPITANSTPDMDTWGPDCYWECADWIEWHKANVAAFGKAVADQKFAYAFDHAQYLGHETFCIQNPPFVEYIKAQQLQNSSTILAKLFDAVQWGDSVKATTDKVGEAVDNVLDTAIAGTDSISKLMNWLPYIVAGALILFGVLIYQQKKITV